MARRTAGWELEYRRPAPGGSEPGSSAGAAIRGDAPLTRRPARARRLLVEARELAVWLDSVTTAMVDDVLGFVRFVEEDAAEPVQHLEQALTTINAMGDVRDGAILSVVLAWAPLTDQARRDEARQRLEHAHQHRSRWRSPKPILKACAWRLSPREPSSAHEEQLAGP